MTDAPTPDHTHTDADDDRELAALEALEHFVFDARWFSGKGREGQLAGLEQPDWIVPPGDGTPGVRSEYVTVAYPDGSVEYYHLLASYRSEPLAKGLVGPALEPGLGYLHDAPHDPQAMQALVAALLAGSPDPGVWESVLPDGSKLSADLTSKVFGGEQSNTNVLLGDVALMKIFRKLEPGANLDIQMHDALGRARVPSAARLYGWVTGRLTPFSDEAWTDGAEQPAAERVDLVMISELLRDASDGWELACEKAAAGDPFTEDAAALGTALAQVHAALADTFGTEQLDGDRVAATMRERLATASHAAPALEPLRTGLEASFDTLKGRRLTAQRVHGDFHLGQTLRTPQGWKIIDFEGEPMKSFAERQLPDSALRDVAGMLRSFGYVTSVFDEPTGEQANAWLAGVREAFLAAYQRQAGPVDAQVLHAYEADKATYEVVYETRNRPTWVAIPLSAIEAVVSEAPEAGTTPAEQEH